MARALYHHGTRFRVGLIAVIAWFTVVSLPAVGSAQTVPAASLPVDLAAILLMPADAEAEGRPGLVLNQGHAFMTVAEALAADPYASSRMEMRLSLLPDAARMLRDAGWQRFHEVELIELDPASTATSGSSRFDVSSSIEEYATTDGAAQAFAAFTDEQTVRLTTGGTIQVVPDAAPVGDQSIMWNGSGTNTNTGLPAGSLARIVRIGSRIVSITMVDYTEPISVDAAELERLTARLLTHVEQIGATGQPCPPAGATGIRVAITDRSGLHPPGLSTCVLRLANTDADPTRAFYTVLDGTVIQRWVDTPDELAKAQADAEATGLRDRYEEQYTIDRDGKRALSYVTVDRYADGAAATTAFASLEERLRANTDTTLVSFETGIPVIGDASATYATTTASTRLSVTASTTRIDDIVITVRISQTAEPIPAVTQTLLLSQVGCMEANDCTQPISVPLEIVPAWSPS